MLPAILHKLDRQIRGGITTETQALYFMAQVRKSLEHGIITLQDDNIIKLYCDWVLHSSLKGPYAQKVLIQLNPAHDFYFSHDADIELPEDIYAQILPIISLDDFRRSLHDYLIKAGLPDAMVCHPPLWHGFLRAYLGIIEDCPLKVWQDNATISIKEIIANVSHDGARLRAPEGERYSFTVHWTFVGKDGVTAVVNNHLTIPAWVC